MLSEKSEFKKYNDKIKKKTTQKIAYYINIFEKIKYYDNHYDKSQIILQHKKNITLVIYKKINESKNSNYKVLKFPK